MSKMISIDKSFKAYHVRLGPHWGHLLDRHVEEGGQLLVVVDRHLGESGQRKCSYAMIAHRKFGFQLRFIEARKRLASVRWLEMGCC